MLLVKKQSSGEFNLSSFPPPSLGVSVLKCPKFSCMLPLKLHTSKQWKGTWNSQLFFGWMRSQEWLALLKVKCVQRGQCCVRTSSYLPLLHVKNLRLLYIEKRLKLAECWRSCHTKDTGVLMYLRWHFYLALPSLTEGFVADFASVC